MGLARAVGANERHTLTVINLVGERTEQVVHRHAVELRNTTRCIGATKPNVDLLVGYRRRWRAGGDELFPTGFCRVRLRGVLEILRGTLLHDLHMVEQATLFFVPSLEVVSQQLLSFLACLRKGGE